MAEVKGMRVFCPKCNKGLLQLSFTGILLAPLTTILVVCAQCKVAVNILDAFPDLFHRASDGELLGTTVPFELKVPEGKGGN